MQLTRPEPHQAILFTCTCGLAAPPEPAMQLLLTSNGQAGLKWYGMTMSPVLVQ